MQNKDTLNKTQLEIAQRISNAAKEGNTEEFEAGIHDLFQNIHDSIITQAASIQNSADTAVLAQRGVRVLTSEEVKFYTTLIDAMKATGESNPMMALTGTDKTFPLTIINEVMEDMKQEHPLLAEAKNFLDITWEDTEADKELKGELRRGIAYISSKTGVLASAFEGDCATVKINPLLCRGREFL